MTLIQVEVHLIVSVNYVSVSECKLIIIIWFYLYITLKTFTEHVLRGTVYSALTVSATLEAP